MSISSRLTKYGGILLTVSNLVASALHEMNADYDDQRYIPRSRFRDGYYVQADVADYYHVEYEDFSVNDAVSFKRVPTTDHAILPSADVAADFAEKEPRKVALKEMRECNRGHEYSTFADPVRSGVLLHVKELRGDSVHSKRGPKLKVAFAIFITDIGTQGWKDALAVLAHSIHKAAKRSRHNVSVLALSPTRLSKKHEEFLRSVGYDDVKRRTIPVPPHKIRSKEVREAQEGTMGADKHMHFVQSEEQIKYWGLTLTDFDRVLVLDADTMVLDPMDELMESSADLVGTYDFGLTGSDQTVPVVQGGFLRFKPNLTDFEAIKSLTQEGDFHFDGTGWKGENIGFAYGGTGPDGLLAYYFNRDAIPTLKSLGQFNLPEGIQNQRVPKQRFKAVDRSVYDVVINNKLFKDLKADAKGRGDDREAKEPVDWVSAVKSVHFTGDCIKPWTCSQPDSPACGKLMDRWWALRADFAKERGLNDQRSCNPEYKDMGL
eukprot:TRINITY_DN8338_c0_g1_i2.p1 TRINITY_DN8338_c0_g1~~TRINITY_DN8338_c0_g1_i2.p1  ORF type:complete len:490 (-),score=98.21 TRINITY_DN8338_c0_g1_i2:41-1510(-)